MNCPYDDDYMIFDEWSGHYILTEKALLSRGISFRSDLSETSSVSPEADIDGFLRLVSDMIYLYIHRCNDDNLLQDKIIATSPSARKIIYNAMIYQAVYVKFVGNLLLSTDEKERSKAYDVIAIDWLNQVIPELRRPITFRGRW